MGNFSFTMNTQRAEAPGIGAIYATLKARFA
jgi:hypothetical protein